MPVRSVLHAVITVLVGTALAWGLLRFGATETWSLYGLFLALAAAGLIALVGFRLEALDGLGWLPLALVGGWILGQAAFRPTLAAQGFVHMAVGWLALALTLWLGAASRRAARGLFLFLVLVGTAEAAFALLELRGTVSAIARNPEIQGHLAVGTLINPNHFAGLVNMALALGCGALAALLVRGTGRRRGLLRIAGASVLLPGLGLMALASYRAESHGGMLALVSALVWIALLVVLRSRRPRRRGRTSRGGMVAAALVGLLLVAGIGAVVARPGILSLQHRAEVYRETLTLIRDQPVLGVGPGMYMWRFRPYQSSDIEGRYFHAHNDYLQTAAEWGIPAALVFWAFIAWRLHRSARRWLRSEDPWEAGVALGCSGAIAVILVHSLVDFNLQIPGNLMLFAMIVGLAWSLEAGADRGVGWQPSRRAGSTRRVLMRWLLPLLLLAAGVASARQLAAIQQARRTPGLAGLEGACQLDPRNPELRFRLALRYRDDLERQSLAAARRHFEAAVELNPHAWMYWSELAKLYELLGQDAEAAASYRKTLELNPRSLAYQWQAANFLLRSGDLTGSLPLFRAALADPRLARRLTLDLLLKAGAAYPEIDQVWPTDRAARLTLLDLLIRQDDLELTAVSLQDLLELWRRLLKEDEPPALAAGDRFIRYLLDQGRHPMARQAWLDLAAAGGLVDEPFAVRENYLWNGGFELPLDGGLLAWRQPDAKRTAFRTVRQPGPAGSQALRVDLPGSSVDSRWRLEQLVIVDAGALYELSLAAEATAAWQRSVETTVRVRGRQNRRHLLEAKMGTGSADGGRLSWVWLAPADTFLVDVMIEARSQGAAEADARWWLEAVALKRSGPGERP